MANYKKAKHAFLQQLEVQATTSQPQPSTKEDSKKIHGRKRKVRHLKEEAGKLLFSFHSTLYLLKVEFELGFFL